VLILGDISPELAFVLGALALFAPAIILHVYMRRRVSDLSSMADRASADAEHSREILAALPDGLMVWENRNGQERCSRRLAVMLGLEKGTGSTFSDVLACFDEQDATELKAATDELRRNGSSFELKLNSGRRRIQVKGTRASNARGIPLDDIIWMRDISESDPVKKDTTRDGMAFDHFRILLDALPMPVWIRDGGLEIVFSNASTRNLTDQNLCNSPAAAKLAERAFQDGNPASADFMLEDGLKSRLIEICEVPAKGWNGTIGFAIDLPMDKIETDSNDEVLANLSIAVAIYNGERRLCYHNKAYAEMWGLDTAWLKSHPSFSEILDKLRDHRRLPEVADFRAYKQKQMSQFMNLAETSESLLHLPDGRTLSQVTQPRSEGGLVFVFENVSERLSLERSFKTLNAVQQETIDNLYEGIAVFGPDGRLQLSNPVFAEFWDLQTDALKAGLHLSDFFNLTRPLIIGAKSLSDKDWKSYVDAATARVFNREAARGRIQLNNGTVLEFCDVPLPDGAVLLSYLDVSDSARVEAALVQRAEALQQANVLKSEFIANVSYEIRTPLTTLIGFADILTRGHFGKLNDRQMEYGRGILESAEGLKSVINDMLDLATIEAGMLKLELDTIELHSMLVSVMNLVRERGRRKKLELEFDCPTDIGWIVADEKRLKQLLFNLLSNAVNDTPALGTVRLEAHRRSVESDEWIDFTVSDTGPGLAEAQQLDIFSIVTGNATDPSGIEYPVGAGMGLTLVKRFVELHGGDIEVETKPGRGTRITCRLPASGEGNRENAPELSLVQEN